MNRTFLCSQFLGFFLACLASKSRLDAINNARGEVVRPLVNSVVRHSDFFGCGCDVAAQKFNCSCFFHYLSLTEVQAL
jgi:hypothetical protein